MPSFNPFRQTKAPEIIAKIDRLKKRHPELPPRELAGLVIREKALQCALISALTSVPAIFPGLGTFIAFLGGTTADVFLLNNLIAQMVMEIATLYGRDLKGLNYIKEALYAFILSARAGSYFPRPVLAGLF